MEAPRSRGRPGIRPRGRTPAVSGRPLLVALAAATLLRLALLLSPHLWHDEATTGLLGLTVLRGELPIYFYGQPFMGALDGYLAAPLFWALGVSAHTLELLPVLLSLAWLSLVVRLAHDAFGARAAVFTAVLLVLPSDFFLFWAHEARGHYPLAMALGTLGVLLARRPAGTPGRRAMLRLAILGLVLGLAFWTNFLAIVFFPAAALGLTRGGFPAVWPRALVVTPAFLLGSLPHWLYGIPHGTALPPPGAAIPPESVVAHAAAFGRLAWPVVAGVPASLRDGLSGVALALALGALYVAAAALAGRRLAGEPAAAGPASLALVCLAVANVGAAVATVYGRGLVDQDPHYLLPLGTALPPLLGRLLAALPGARTAGALTALVLAIHAGGALEGSLRVPWSAAAREQRGKLDAQLATVGALERAGLRHLYAPDARSRVLSFLSAERVIVANHYEEIYPPHARAADGALAVALWAEHPVPSLEANLAALGVSFAYRPVSALGGAYVDLALPPERLRELDPAHLVVTASEDLEAAARVLDRDAPTLWGTGRRRRGGEWIQVDLGRPEPVRLVRWLPGTYQEVPGGLVLETSPDGTTWRRPIDLPVYTGPLYWSAGRPVARVRSGRVELRVPPAPARFLRATQLGASARWGWTVRELFVYADAREGEMGRGGSPPPDGPALARALRALGVRRLYADHGWASRVAFADPSIAVPPANLQLDPYGYKGSATELWPLVRWTPGTAVLLEPMDAPGFVRAAARGGLGFTRHSVLGLEAFVYRAPPPSPAPLPAADLRVTTSRHPERAPRAADGEPQSGWSTGRPRAPGDWVQVDLVAPRALRAVSLLSRTSTDWPRGLQLEASGDGARWHTVETTVRTEGRHRWGGIALLRDGVERVWLEFAPVPARALRLTLTAGDAVHDWSIHELTVHPAD